MIPELAGGKGRVLLNLLNAFEKKDFRVHLLLNRVSGPFTESLNPGIRIIHLENTGNLSSIPFYLSYILKWKPDIILTNVVRHTALAIRVRNITREKTKIFPIIHNTYGEAFKKLSDKKKQARLKKIIKYYPLCDKIIAISDGVKDDFCSLTGMPSDSVKRIYNPVVSEELIDLAVLPVEHPWFQPKEPPVILGAGRLEKAKNFPLLIDAFEIARRMVRCRLFIIGEGSEFQFLSSRIRKSAFYEDISLAGYKENPFPYMNRATVFTLSSLWEGLPTVLIEAMAMGTPVISTDCPSGPREILNGNEYGTLVPMNDAEKLSDAILEAFQYPIASATLKRRAAIFSYQASTEEYLKLFSLNN